MYRRLVARSLQPAPASLGHFKNRAWNNYNHRDTPYRRHNNTNYGSRGRQERDYTQRIDYHTKNYHERRERSGERELERSPRKPRNSEDSYRTSGRYRDHHYRDQHHRYQRRWSEENSAKSTVHNDSIGNESSSHPSGSTGHINRNINDSAELAEKVVEVVEASEADHRKDKSPSKKLKSPTQDKPSKDTPTEEASQPSLNPPRIQVRPLTQLLKQEILAVTQENRLNQRPVGSSTPPARISSPSRQTFKPVLKNRRRTVSSSNQNGAGPSTSQFSESEAIINNRIAGMDKESLKYIINNSDTIYDEHLKVQARKRLREEIRRQLKAIELDQPKDNPVTELVEDEIVDAIKLPELLLQEIEKCFGKEFIEDQKLQDTEENLSSFHEFNAPGTEFSEVEISKKHFQASEECNQESATNRKDSKSIKDSEQSSKKSDHQSNEPALKIENQSNSNQNKVTEEFTENDNTIYAPSDIIQDNSGKNEDKVNQKLEIQAKRKERRDRRKQNKLEFKMKRSKDLMSRLKAADEVKMMAEKRLAKSRGPLLPTPPDGRIPNKFDLPQDQPKRKSEDPRAASCESETNAMISVPEIDAPPDSEAEMKHSPSQTRERTPKLSESKKQSTRKTPSVKQTSKSTKNKSDINIPLNKVIKSESNTSPIRISSLPKDVIELLSSSEEDVGEENSTVDMEIDAPEENQAMEPEPATIDDAASDHSSNSHCSTESEKRRFRLKLQSDAENVVDSFEKLILPHLRETLSDRYHFQHSANLQSRLHFISCVVTSSEHNPKRFSKIDVAKIQRNLKAPDNRQSIEFLLKEIVSVVSLQKQRRREQEEQTAVNGLSPKKVEQIVKETPKASTSPISSMDQRLQKLPAPQSPNGLTSVVSLSPLQSPPALPAAQNPQPYPIGLPFMSMDSNLYRFYPAGFSQLRNGTDKVEPLAQVGELLTQNIAEIDRHLMENQNRRSILEEMIVKFQQEISHLDKQSLELQSRKIMLLISSNQTVTAAPPPPVASSRSSPPPVSPTQEPTQEENVRQTRSRTRFRYVKLLPRRVKLIPKRATKKSVKSDEVSDQSQQEIADKEECDQEQAKEEKSRLENLSDVEEEIQDETDSPPTAKPKSSPLSKQKASVSKHPLAVIPPLPPPPPPPEPICHFSDELHPSTDFPELNSQCNVGLIPQGMLHDVVSPITQLRIFRKYVIAASEDGDIYMFHLISHKLERKITKHSEAITNMFLCEKDSLLYTTSLDGFFKKTSLENLERVMQTVYFKEPLQSIDIAWGVAFIGSRWGNIFTFNVTTNKQAEMSLVSTGQSIIAIKATKEGVRKILILGCKGSSIYMNDATNGLLLRRLCVPGGLNVYSLLLSDGHIYCGTQKNQIYQFEFVTGNLVTKLSCGNGAVSIVSYKERYLLAGCYDGFIYVLDKVTGKQVGRFEGAGRLVLALAVAGDKIVTSSKDNSLGILEVPAAMVNDQ
nr:putative leucine-rich repeat-containing protein DDB_G0290503 isoform X2 [Drosophila kikkawai]